LAEYGITLLGNYRGLPVYASESQYTDSAGVSQYYVPPDKVLVAASGCKAPWPTQASFKSMRMRRQCILTKQTGFRWSSTKRATTFERCDYQVGRFPFPRTLNHGPFSTLSKHMSTYTLPSNLGDILGAHHDGNFQTQVSEIKAGIGTLKRGTILATGSGADIGKLVLLTPTTEAQAYGILLDEAIDTAVAFGDGSVTGSIAKKGSFKGSALLVPTGVDAGLIAVSLRGRGIFVEGSIPVPPA
jgi:hypothetical protein